MPTLPLQTPSDLDAAVQTSAAQPVVIFKHSLTCGTSAMAAEEVEDLVSAAVADLPVYILTIQRARDLSWEIERRFGVRHESPQVLVLRDGQVVWHASHFRVTADAIRAAVESVSAAV